jgi:type VI secretion system protein VasD
MWGALQMPPCSAATETVRQLRNESLRRLAVGIVLVLAGCSSPPPPPPAPTVVELRFSATAADNATPDGQGAPIAIRVYQLASRSGFEGAEFYPLYRTDSATLGPDLIKKEEFLLAPGSTKSLHLTPADTVHAIGVFGAYRDFQNVSWRAAADVPAHRTTTITITADRPGLKLEAITAKPASP